VSKNYTATVDKDPESGEYILTFTDQFCEEQDWRTGDVIKWDQKEDGTITMINKCSEERKSKPKKLVLVEAVSMFRMRYVVECDEEEHAADEVVMRKGDDNFKEFSQQHLDEVVTSTRVISEQEYMDLFNKDNEYLVAWEREKKKSYINKIEYD
jgi:hypothetical protein